MRFDSGDGVFAIVEGGMQGEFDGRHYKLGLGLWHHSARFDDIAGTPRERNRGLYMIGERELLAFGDSGRSIGAFVQLGFARGDRNQVDRYLGMGLNWQGPLPGRAADVLGLAFAHARNSDGFDRITAGGPVAETAFELTYRFSPLPWLALQPDVQYIVDPGAAGGIDNALVVGMRVEAAF